ncbi:unnamed protein product [Adineta steineri]|uniref:VWA7 N-terminal domain-containing protein n=1 Tax=Adineta steineri TaxID=433720 RepID=A0A819X3P9_9BILA|nr:unnamed protein product [Adineta steineri]CAF4131833.1 unnamed protein product [Adineta steineri]
MSRLSLIFLLIFLTIIQGFIPHPSIRVGGQAGESITHTEITQIAFVRSLARYLLEIKAIHKYEINNNTEYSIDDLYELTYPEWSKEKLHIQTYPLKSVLDTLLVENAFVDIDKWTKKLPAAHFDSEAFSNASRRMIKIRKIIINDVLNTTKDLIQARQLLGQILHTLQDFYSHSNWIELGKKDINTRLGIYEDIGPVASPNQPACINKGCITKRVKCNFLQKITLNKCPLEYYECKDNIHPDIIKKQLLTSGYSVNQHNEDNQPIAKPTNVDKCSHGSVMDTSSHISAIGGINKDTIISIYSPHFDLHYEAATMAVLATERFFNDLRKDLGDANFDRLFAITPTSDELHAASQAVAHLRKFRFFTPSISSGLTMGSRFIDNLKKTAKKRWNKLKWALFPNKNELTIEDVSFRRKRSFNF